MGSGFEVYTQSTCNGKRRKRINAGHQHDAEKMEWHCHGFAVSRPRCGARVKDRYWHADGKYTLLMPSWDCADKSLSLAFPCVVTLPGYQSADAARVSPSVCMSVSNHPPPHIAVSRDCHGPRHASPQSVSTGCPLSTQFIFRTQNASVRQSSIEQRAGVGIVGVGTHPAPIGEIQ